MYEFDKCFCMVCWGPIIEVIVIDICKSKYIFLRFYLWYYRLLENIKYLLKGYVRDWCSSSESPTTRQDIFHIHVSYISKIKPIKNLLYFFIFIYISLKLGYVTKSDRQDQIDRILMFLSNFKLSWISNWLVQ
jgi:hypothetical protein